MQEGKGWHAIQQQVQLLEGAHLQHLMLYGNGNSKRLTGQHRTSSAMHFTWGLEDRSASIRIPHSAFLHQRGWYEDRRPASNMDPYLVSSLLETPFSQPAITYLDEAPYTQYYWSA